MKGVMILAHGSRVQATKDTLNKIVDMVREKLGDMPITVSYMEFCEEDIAYGIKDLVEQGVTDIKIVPYFLFEGIHIRQDIPEEVGKVLENYPGVTATMGDTLGADSRLADILVDRIRG